MIFVKKYSSVFFMFCLIHAIQSQITVSSLEELKPYLDDDNVHIKLAAGTYWITEADVNNSLFEDDITIGGVRSIGLLLFRGNGSTYDFTDVILNIETGVFSAYDNQTQVYELHIVGNNNVVKNLTLVDVGELEDNPSRGALSICLDGHSNRVEGIHATIKGSTPYAYGDIFGKGGGAVISHRKHSACLVRGNSNHVKNCTFIHRAYGHGIFFQAANNPIIEGCYLEGELRTVADVLAEEGTGSPADNVNFETVWGFNLKDVVGNYAFSLQEDGIRAYNGGHTIIDGIEYERGVNGVTVVDCTVKKMRSGITIGWASGNKYVDNCTTLACETGFWVGSDAQVINCKSDASIGPIFSEDRERNNSDMEITLLDNYVPRVGDTPGLYLAGNNHTLTIKDGTTCFDSDIKLLVGGLRQSHHRWLEGSSSPPPNYTASNCQIDNQTPYPLILGDTALNNDVVSCGSVTNDGSGNSISNISSCTIAPECVNECGDFLQSLNVALFKEASQNSFYNETEGGPNLAVDGNPNGQWSNGSVTHTEGAIGDWWQVDLGITYPVGIIRIFNRTNNCCVHRLGDFTVSVIDVFGRTVWSQRITTAPNPSVALDAQAVLGRFIKITQNLDEPLSLAEVEVFATESNIFPNPSKTYLIDVPHHEKRLVADGINSFPYLTTTDDCSDALWRFVQQIDGYWNVQLVNNGVNTRITANEDSQLASLTSSVVENDNTYFELTSGSLPNTYYLTLPNGPSSFQRLQINDQEIISFVPMSNASPLESFQFTEVGDFMDFCVPELYLTGELSSSTFKAINFVNIENVVLKDGEKMTVTAQDQICVGFDTKIDGEAEFRISTCN